MGRSHSYIIYDSHIDYNFTNGCSIYVCVVGTSAEVGVS